MPFTPHNHAHTSLALSVQQQLVTILPSQYVLLPLYDVTSVVPLLMLHFSSLYPRPKPHLFTSNPTVIYSVQTWHKASHCSPVPG